jgi:hypothetical protein
MYVFWKLVNTLHFPLPLNTQGRIESKVASKQSLLKAR